MTGRFTAEQWFEMSYAPRDGEPIILLYYDSGALRPCVGQFLDGCWISKMPLTSQKVMVAPRLWRPIPEAPAFAD